MLENIFNAATMQASIENDTQKSTKIASVKANNKTALCSNILRKECVTESAQIDFMIIVAFESAAQIHVQQLVAFAEQCNMLEKCKNKSRRISEHVKVNIKKHSLSLSIDSNVISTTDFRYQKFLHTVFESSEFKSQLISHASSLFAMIDTHVELTDEIHASAIKQNKALVKALKADSSDSKENAVVATVAKKKKKKTVKMIVLADAHVAMYNAKLAA